MASKRGCTVSGPHIPGRPLTWWSPIHLHSLNFCPRLLCWLRLAVKALVAKLRLATGVDVAIASHNFVDPLFVFAGRTSVQPADGFGFHAAIFSASLIASTTS